MTIKKHNKKPEKVFQQEILLILRRKGFDIDVVEAKAVFSQKARRYLHSQATPGMTDLVGNDSSGIALFVELKAPGKLKTLRENQRHFLKRKISSNSFACVTDSVERFFEIYEKWKEIKETKSMIEAQFYLIDMIP